MNRKIIISSFVVLAVFLASHFISRGYDNTSVGDQSFSDQLRIITILIPENLSEYVKAVDEYVSVGGINPSDDWKFVEKKIATTFDSGFDLIRTSADLAAKQLGTGGGPEHASVSYLKIQNKVAYVVLNIDLDGWAGVSFSIAKIHPIVEKTLLQFPSIKSVKFEFAPGDSVNDMKSV